MILTAIGNRIGKTMKVDGSTLLLTRGSFARIGVQVNLKESLLPRIIYEKKEYMVEYEGLHCLCFRCGKYGHVETECKERGVEQNVMREDVVVEQSKVKHHDNKENMFGEWMAVRKDKRVRRGVLVTQEV